jgi:hypothetical protein
LALASVSTAVKCSIEQINLREKLDQVRRIFDGELAAVVRGRPDLSHAGVKQRFGVSEKVIRRVIKEFSIGTRRRGPKPKLQRAPFSGHTQASSARQFTKEKSPIKLRIGCVVIGFLLFVFSWPSNGEQRFAIVAGAAVDSVLQHRHR